MASGIARPHPREKVLNDLDRIVSALERLFTGRHLGKLGFVVLLLAWAILARTDQGPTGSFIRSFSNFVMGVR